MFPNFLRFYIVRQLVMQVVRTMFISNNRASFHLWWNKNLVKRQRVSKYYENFVILNEDSDTGGPSLVAVRIEYLFAYQFWYWELWVGNLWGGESNKLQIPCTYNLPTLHIYSTSKLEGHLESSRTSAVKRFCRNSQRVKPVGYFCRRAPSCIFDKMFDRILNATLPNNWL